MSHLYEKDIQRVSLGPDPQGRASITGGLREALMAITDNSALEKRLDTLQDECKVVMELMEKAVRENARVLLDHRQTTRPRKVA